MKVRNISQLIKENYKPVLLVFIALMLMVIISFRSSGRIVSRQMQLLGDETLNNAELNVTHALLESRITFANIAVTLESMLDGDRNNEEILLFLENMNEYFKEDEIALPDFLKIYAYINGEFLDGSGWVPPAGYVPEERVWYTGAVQIDDIYFSDPYLDADTGDICISFSKAMFDSSEQLAGVLAIDLNLSRIISYMQSLELGAGSYGLLVNNQLQFVSQDQEHLIGSPLEEAGDGYRTIAAMLRAGEVVSAQRLRDTDGTDSVAFFRPVFNGWYLGLIIPRSSYYETIYKLGAGLGALGLSLAVILSALLLRTRYDRMISIQESRSKSNFLSRMSHEMRTPMNAIIGMSSISKKSDDVDRIRYCVSQIDIAANHLLGIINDVLDISKIESGKFSICETEFVVTDMLERVIGVLRHSLHEKSLKFHLDIKPGVPYAIISDQQRLSQVAANLLSNAIKFTPQHGDIGLTLELLETDNSSALLQVQVRDNGIGLEASQIKNLFQPFQQADNTISRKYGGTGLGLAISKNIVERLGGSIRVESKPGIGSVFSFTFRAKVSAWNKAAADSTSPADPANTADHANAADTTTDTPETQPEDITDIFADKSILMAEDVEINAEILITLLAETGIQIDWAENGLQACDKFNAAPDRYDLILMDIHMPELDGYEATRRIRASASAQGRSIPIIAMTANVFQEDIDHCLRVGMNDHLGKPLDIDEVINKLKLYLL